MRSLDWNHLRAFHATATTGSLSGAARQLGLTQPTLSRQVQSLEEQLGVALFERPGRKLVLTPTGHEMLKHIGTMADAAQAAALTASGEMQELRGRVRISASDSVAAYLLPGIALHLRDKAPRLTIEILAANELSDLHRMEADIAIRHQSPDRPGLTGQHLRDTEAGFYASEDWIARNGMPATLAELAGDDLLGFDDTDRFSAYLRGTGIPMEADDFRLISSSSVTVWEMVKRGLGVAPMLCDIAKRTPGVVRLLPDLATTPVPIWLVTHDALQASPRIRLVLKVLAKELGARTGEADSNSAKR
ncbi:LysR family transcriptional regulator [Stappia taiwanensis]|uniref:LysR family transcriptional regulator n=2 Tax=Stappia taiwanensis TaxID=992267 RepID=A0A838XSK0_9HYPH|nr:LysR family transcriptional regulator [Stappia taiwanensis]GGE82229.1 LysR family transcriptional regulator [Stappia taiwanensis]